MGAGGARGPVASLIARGDGPPPAREVRGQFTGHLREAFVGLVFRGKQRMGDRPADADGPIIPDDAPFVLG